MYHPLTKKVHNLGDAVFTKKQAMDYNDKTIRLWLKEKAEEIKKSHEDPLEYLDKILEITEEKTLEEKMREYLDTQNKLAIHSDWRKHTSEKLSKIAEDHYKEGKE